jgi:hypothetical protein
VACEVEVTYLIYGENMDWPTAFTVVGVAAAIAYVLSKLV